MFLALQCTTKELARRTCFGCCEHYVRNTCTVGYVYGAEEGEEEAEGDTERASKAARTTDKSTPAASARKLIGADVPAFVEYALQPLWHPHSIIAEYAFLLS